MARVCVAVSAILAGATLATVPADAVTSTVVNPLVQQVSTDTLPAFTPNGTSIQHSTEQETDTFSWGSTVVSAFQVGRTLSGFGAQAIGWATSKDNGQSWAHGILPGLTVSSPSPSSYPLVVNQSVGYDARHATWLIPSITYVATTATRFHEKALLVNRSANGTSWAKATTVVSTNADKAWVTCDNTRTSPHYGTCYVAYAQLDSADTLAVVRTANGGATWSTPVALPTTGYNANPVVRPDGTLVVVATDVDNGANGSALIASVSTNGGLSFSAPSRIATIAYHLPAGGNRAKNKPSVDIDKAGVVYVAWSDCRFHASCAADDIVYATSSNGTTWSAPHRVALDATTTAEDKFIPGLAVQPATSGSSAHLAVVFYTYKTGSCASTCLIQAKYASSYNAGTTWSAPYTINAAGMPASWLPVAGGVGMLGDYLSVSFCNASAITVVSVATGPKNPGYHQSEYALTVPVGWGSGTKRASALSAGRPVTAAPGQLLAVSTTLSDPGTHIALARARVELQRRPVRGGTFTNVGPATTDSAGVARLRTAVPSTSARYRWTWAGSSVYAAATSASQTIGIRQIVHVAASKHRIAVRQSTKIYGTVAPSATGRTVTLQRFVHGAWHAVPRTRATVKRQTLPNGQRTSGYVLTYSSTARGTELLRVARAATMTNLAGYSAKVTIHVV